MRRGMMLGLALAAALLLPMSTFTAAAITCPPGQAQCGDFKCYPIQTCPANEKFDPCKGCVRSGGVTCPPGQAQCGGFKCNPIKTCPANEKFDPCKGCVRSSPARGVILPH